MKNRPIEIFVNGRFLTQPITGVQRIGEEFIKAIDRLIDENRIDQNELKFVLISPKSLHHTLNLKHVLHQKVGLSSGHVWEQVELLWLTRGKLLLSLCGPSPILKFKQVVLLPDASVYVNPQHYTFTYRTWYKFMIRILGRVSRHVVTISNFSASELVKHASIPAEKVQVIYLGTEQIRNAEKDDSVLVRNRLHDKRFILAVSSFNPNKNFQTVAKAINLLKDSHLEYVVAGSGNKRVFGEIDEIQGITYVGHVSDGELKSLYSEALCFVFPSFYEGFGLPPMEAMTCGCPVVVSKTSSMPEICGQAALYCDPSSAEDIARNIKRIVDDVGLQQQLRERGMVRSKEYSWIKFTLELLEIVNKIIQPDRMAVR